MIRSDDASKPLCPHCHSSAARELVSLCAFKVSSGHRFELKRGAGHNPYQDLTLDHIKDELGRPVKVNSESELHAAEKRYGFVHAASWGLQDQAPQHEKWAGNIAHNYKRKFNLDPDAYKPENNPGVSAGVVGSDKETLAYHPNSTKEIGA